MILNIRNINKKKTLELRSEKQREYQTDQRAGKAALGQPARIGPKAEPRRAPPWGGGSLVPPRQARERRTVYIPGCDSPPKLLSIAGSTLPNSRPLCPVGPTSSRVILHHGPASWPITAGFLVVCRLWCMNSPALVGGHFFGILPCVLIFKSHTKLYTCSLACNTHFFLHI